MQRIGSGKSGGDQKLDLLPAELRPFFIRDYLHRAVQKTKLSDAASPWRTKMIAAATGIAVEKNADAWVVRFFVQSLDIDTRTLIFRQNGMIRERCEVEVSVITRPA